MSTMFAPFAESGLKTMEEELIKCIKKRDVDGTSSLLAKGANATLVTCNGQTPIGYAASKGHADLLEILLRSCNPNVGGSHKATRITDEDDKETNDCDGKSDAKKMKTPDGMDALQWEEEIQSVPGNHQLHDDEGSRLYIYYAQMIEKTGEILSNTIHARDPHCLDVHKHAPIHYAAMYGNVKCVELLLDYQCPVDLPTVLGLTPLHLAVNYPSVVRTLLAHRANPNPKHWTSHETPLHRAVLANRVRVVEQLLDAGADANATTNRGQTSLMLAASENFTAIVHILVERNAFINAHDENGRSALYQAVTNDHIEIAECLLRRGARCTVHDYLLQHCVRKNQLHMLRLLVKCFKKCVSIRDDSGWSPVYLAMYERNAPMIELLLDHGATLDATEWFRKELHIVMQNSPNLDAFRPTAYVLLQHGVEIDTYNYFDETPLTQSIMMEKYPITEFLVKEGADVNTSDTEHLPNGLLLLRRTDQVHLTQLLIYAGMNFHCFTPSELNLKASPTPRPDESVEDYLTARFRRPLSLQQLSRIVIRNRLIDRMQTISEQKRLDRSTVVQHRDGSILRHNVWATGLPGILQTYVFDFPDVPLVRDVEERSLFNRILPL